MCEKFSCVFACIDCRHCIPSLLCVPNLHPRPETTWHDICPRDKSAILCAVQGHLTTPTVLKVITDIVQIFSHRKDANSAYEREGTCNKGHTVTSVSTSCSVKSLDQLQVLSSSFSSPFSVVTELFL